MAELPADLLGAITSGERVLWWGRPRQGLVLRGSDAIMIPFSLLWCGFSIFWETGVLSSRAPWFFALWGIPFVAIGVYIVVGRFFFEAWQRSTTFYALTSERILIVSRGPSRTVKSLALGTLSDVTLTEGRGGSGTITFGPQLPRQAKAPRFDLIDDAKAVYEQVRSAQRT